MSKPAVPTSTAMAMAVRDLNPFSIHSAGAMRLAKTRNKPKAGTATLATVAG